MSEVKKLIKRYSRDFDGRLVEDPNGAWVLHADAWQRDRSLNNKLDAQRLRADTAEAERDTLQQLADDREELLNRCMHAFNHVVGFSSLKVRTAWYENFLKPVTGAVMIHLSEIAALNPKPEAGSHDRLCPGCGAKGWTANCDQCIPY